MSLILQRPTYGSKIWYGNFTLGLMIDSHPRWINIIIGLWFFEIGVAFTRETI